MIVTAKNIPSLKLRNLIGSSATWTLISCVGIFLASTLYQPSQKPGGFVTRVGVTVQSEVSVKAKEILDKKCAKCHNEKFLFDPKSRASLVTHKVVVPGNSSKSPIIVRIAEGTMPPKENPPVTKEELEVLKDWIDKGASDWADVQVPPATGPAGTRNETLALQVQKIFDSNCSKCHNLNFLFDPKSRASMVSQKVILPGDSEGSKVVQRISDKSMPPQGNTPVSSDDLSAIKEWIKSGAPDWTAGQVVKALNISDGQILAEVIKDLSSQPEDKRPYVRYFSSHNLLRNSETLANIKKYEGALSKLLNSLSWSPDIAKVTPFGTGNALYRLDLRDLDWTNSTWSKILELYPYGMIPSGQRGAVDQIRALSGATIPYVRVDWLIANASIPPLYHDILEIPDNLPDLEKKLGVDAKRNQDENKVIRAGLANSGVSISNRAVERHRTTYGYYWKSFDFASNTGRKNIFQFPLDFKEDGGEFIWSLPNGMQAYMIATAAGKRLNVAPSNIVRDRSGIFDDVNVTNGLSCISCHANGMNQFQNQVRQDLDTRQKTDFDLDRAKNWYVTSKRLKEIFTSDSQHFGQASAKTGNIIPTDPNGELILTQTAEPITQVAILYNKQPVTVGYAAAETGLSIGEFKKRLIRSPNLISLGLGLLLQENGTVKRDNWEQNFGKVVDELGIGEYVTPHGKTRDQDADPRIQIRIVASGSSALTKRLKSKVVLTLGRSDELKPVNEGGTEIVTLSANEDGSTATIRASIGGTKLEVEGDLENFDGLASNLADQIHQTLAHHVVPTSGSTVGAPKTNTISIGMNAPSSTEQLLALALKTGTIGVALSTDRGPGATFKMGEEIIVRFSVNETAFAALYDIDSSGRVTLLFPNAISKENRLNAGQIYTGDTWGLIANGVPGRERLFMLVAKSNESLPGVTAFVQNPSGDGLISKSVGAFARAIESKSKGSNSNALGASVVEFFTAK